MSRTSKAAVASFVVLQGLRHIRVNVVPAESLPGDRGCDIDLDAGVINIIEPLAQPIVEALKLTRDHEMPDPPTPPSRGLLSVD